MKTIDVTALGEILIDFTENGTSSQGNPLIEVNPGGAPCNVLAMLRKFDRQVAFIGKVGNDTFGHFLAQRVSELGIDTRCLSVDKSVHTTLAFVHTLANGDRDFSFYRDPGADMMLNESEIDEDLIKRSKIFHFGTLSMTHKIAREATLKALSIAKESGCIISFDPNIREPLWESLEDARRQVEASLAYCNVLKISDNEIRWFTGENDFSAGVSKLWETFDIPLILVSMGEQGSRAYYKGLLVEAEAFRHEHTIDTTGAGDTFFGCILNSILDWGLDDLDEEKLSVMLRFANAAASLITTRKGALCSMFEREEIQSLVESKKTND